MSRVYKLSNGDFGPHPETKVEAIRYKSVKYDGMNECPDCGRKSAKFVSTDNCMMCQRIKMEIVRHSYAHPEGVVPYPENAPLPIGKVDWGSEIQEAIKLLNGDLRMSPHPCKTHGHIGLVNDGGQCHYCAQMLTPLKQALADNNEWYIPKTPCKGCREIVMRHVETSECLDCGYKVEGRGLRIKATDKPDGRETPDSILMREQPDMVIDKVTADECDMKVYRTGKPCNKGHTGWRYVKYGKCIPCLRGEK